MKQFDPVPSPVRRVVPLLPLILWTCLWFNLNSGFWDLRVPQSAGDWQLLIRSVLPFIVLPVAILVVISKRRRSLRASPSQFLFVYGMIAAAATVFSPEPGWSAYWSIAFLATILAAWTFVTERSPVEATRLLLHATWGATFLVAAILGYRSSSLIFGDASTAYGAVAAELHGLTRSSGVARWAAVPGLVCIVRAFHSRKFLPIALYIAGAAVAFFIVYRMQSRGAVFGAVAALVFILLVSSRMRRYALPFAVIAIIFISIIETPETASQHVVTYLKRGQTNQEFLSMTGRVGIYEQGLVVFESAPILGRGQWADRLTIDEHVHNSYMQALLNGGLIGFIPYMASWIAGWILFLRLQKRRSNLAPQDRLCLLECGAVMMFFTVRAIPETTTASFAVDLLVMVAIYVYLETLSTVSSRAPLRRVFLVPVRATVSAPIDQIPEAS